MDNDRQLFEELVQMFLRDAPGKLDQAKQALQAGDAAALAHAAHALKGMVAMFSAKPSVQAAQRVEQQAGQGRMDAQALAALEHAVTALCVALRSYQW